MHLTYSVLFILVDFDTGSSDLFLPGPDCDASCSGHTTYDPSKSSAAKDTGKSFQTQFGDGSTVSGEIFTDTVAIAGLTASKQAIGAAKQYSDGFSSQNFKPDGLMGMAFESIAEFKAPPVFQTLISQKAVSQSVFSFKLSETGAQLTLGGTGSSKSDFVFAPVTQQAFWSVNMDSVSVGGKAALSKMTAIIDTGTTLVRSST
jgi:cathepsin D